MSDYCYVNIYIVELINVTTKVWNKIISNYIHGELQRDGKIDLNPKLIKVLSEEKILKITYSELF